MGDKFLVQDSRTYVGNDILFWQVGGGYTTNIQKAERFDRKTAMKMNRERASDIPWPEDYILKRVSMTVDMQDASLFEAKQQWTYETYKGMY